MTKKNFIYVNILPKNQKIASIKIFNIDTTVFKGKKRRTYQRRSWNSA